MSSSTPSCESAGLPKYLSAAEVAEWLGASENWVYRIAREGRLPCIRLGRKVLFRPSAVVESLQEMEQ